MKESMMLEWMEEDKNRKQMLLSHLWMNLCLSVSVCWGQDKSKGKGDTILFISLPRSLIILFYLFTYYIIIYN